MNFALKSYKQSSNKRTSDKPNCLKWQKSPVQKPAVWLDFYVPWAELKKNKF